MQDCFGSSLAERLAHHQNEASLSLFYRYLADVHLNWLRWFHFLILKGGVLFILIDCMIFQSPFVHVSRVSMSTLSFLAQLDSGILYLFKYISINIRYAHIWNTVVTSGMVPLVTTWNCQTSYKNEYAELLLLHLLLLLNPWLIVKM